VLLLGDSFSNIYSQSGMGWGEGAGLAEQLSLALNCPLDRIVINAGGSYTTRQRLRAELLGGKNRLAGKRVVVYQFAVRDLLAGDWKLLDLPPPPTALSTAARPARFSEEREP
jgi:alginate O-acetyltransferase complex protein AlgJ